jgi:O-antigen ligase
VHLGLGAHNTYISILGQFGIVVAIPFVGMVTIMLKETFEFARRYYMQDTYALVPLASMTCFVTLSLAEGMLMKSSMFMAFIMAGYSFSYRRERDYTE